MKKKRLNEEKKENEKRKKPESVSLDSFRSFNECVPRSYNGLELWRK